MMSEHGLEIVNSRKIIACQKNVININQYESKRLTPKVFEERVISLDWLKPLTNKTEHNLKKKLQDASLGP
jgi:hypothetical protein